MDAFIIFHKYYGENKESKKIEKLKKLIDSITLVLVCANGTFSRNVFKTS